MDKNYLHDGILGMVDKIYTNKVFEEKILPNLKRNRSFKELFGLIWDLKESHEMLNPAFTTPPKTKMAAETLRSEGIAFFFNGDYIRSLRSFDMAILYAPHPVIKSSGVGLPAPASASSTDDLYAAPKVPEEKYGGCSAEEGQTLALCYADRSAVLFYYNLYEKCLKDIEFARKYGCPEEMQQTLLDRKRACLTAIVGKAKSCPVQTKTETEGGKKRAPVDQCGSKITMIAGTTEMGKISAIFPVKDELDLTKEEPLVRERDDPPEIAEPNPKMPALSRALQVTHEPFKGRSIFATRDIRPGEVLGVERAYCFGINDISLAAYCAACLNHCYIPHPCPGCYLVVFCDEKCRASSLAQDHWIECVVQPTVLTAGLGKHSLIYKTLKTFSSSRLRAVLAELEKEKYDNPKDFGFDRNGIYNSDSYLTFHYLCTNKHSSTFGLLLTQCYIAFFFTKLLHYCDRFFIDDKGRLMKPTREDFVTTGAVILANLMKTRCNAHHIYDSKTMRPLGSGIFPTISLFNHNCNAPTIKYYRGRHMVVRASRPIRAGEEVAICYTNDFYEEDKTIREASLARFSFVCWCETCKNGWPLLSEMTVCRANCHTETVHQEIQNAVNEASDVTLKMVTDVPLTKEDLDRVCTTIEVLDKHLLQPCQISYYLKRLLFKLCVNTKL